MKTQLVLLAIAALCILSFSAGSAVKGPKVPPRRAITGDETLERRTFSGQYPGSYSLGPGDSIGFTTYDLGTNGSARRTLINFGDGTLAMVQMVSEMLDPITPDRGSWYSYSSDGGLTWPPLVKIEANRRGWASIDQFQAAGGIEAVISHDFAAYNMELNVDADRGVGVWTSTSPVGASVWPRMAIGDAFTVHIVASIGGNPPTGIVYSRSPDGGTTFDILDMPIFISPGDTADADGQDIDAQGSNVAIVSAGQGGDVALLESTDNGDSWTETIVYDVAGQGELPTGEEEFQPDGSCSVAFDNLGTIHIFWSNFLAVGDATNNPELFYSVDAPIMHWTAAGGITNVAYPLPDTSIGTPPGRGGNYATQPDVGIDPANELYVVYSAMVNDQDINLNYYEHVFVIQSTDGGVNWSPGLDITPGNGFDAAFPTIADQLDLNTAHVMYYCDLLAGNFVFPTPNHAQIPVAIMYLQYTDFIEDVGGSEGDLPARYVLAQNHPNPFNPSTAISYQLTAASQVSLKVYDLLGREVVTLVNEEKAPGSYNVTWDASGQSSGMYFYRLRAGNFVQTRKMVVLK